MCRHTIAFAACSLTVLFAAIDARAEDRTLLAIPDKLVVLTFDDSVKSHFTQARPLLKRLGFGATFFITEGFTFRKNKSDYMTWDEIKQLHDDGFEIGNHTRDHLVITEKNFDQVISQLEPIEARCREHGIPPPTSFAWPGNGIVPSALPLLRKHGIRFARRGGFPEREYGPGQGFAYSPGLDDPLWLPSAGDARPHWTGEDFAAAVKQAHGGKVAILQFHGVPEGEHPWVDTPHERFEEFMLYLKENEYKVISVRDLAKYVDPDKIPADPFAVINARKQELEKLKKP